MGYTHYWDRPLAPHPQERWSIFIALCRKLYKNMPAHSRSSGACCEDEPLHLSGCYRYQRPQFTKTQVVFNGSHIPPKDRVRGPEGEWECSPLDHETFYIGRVVIQPDYREGKPTHFSFCKTARKPYDLMVQACLICYKIVFPEVSICSDGDVDDWREAAVFVQSVLSHILLPETPEKLIAYTFMASLPVSPYTEIKKGA